MNIGLIGVKGHQDVVFRGVQELGGWQLAAAADEDQTALAAWMQNEPLAAGAQAYQDWRQLLEHSMLDVCCLCDENGVRAEQIIALAERDIHIVTEKPLATTLAELDRVRKALSNSRSRLTMLLTMRHEARYATMRRLIQEGVVGPICQVTSQKSYRLGDRPEWQRSREKLGGTIPFIGIHALDLMRWICGMDYTHVAAFHGNGGKPEMKQTEDHASVLLRFTSGASATARLDYLRPMTAPTHGDDRIRVAGGEGVLEAASLEDDLLLITTEEPPRRIPSDPTPNLFVAFAQALASGAPSPISSEDSLYITEVVLRARDAADRQELIALGP